MALLPVPIVDQQTPITADGKPSENKQMDCVAASICAVLLFLSGQTSVTKTLNPDALKDAAYGDAYTGGTDASRYIPVLQQMGYRLYSISGSSGQLIQDVHEYIENKHMPCVFTQVDPYVPTSYGWTHVCVFVGSQPGELTCMDPWAARYITKDDADWLSGAYPIVNNTIWLIEKEDDMSIDIHNSVVNDFFEELNPHQWKCISKGKIVQYGMLNYYKNNGLKPLCGLSWPRLPLTNERPIESFGPDFDHLKGKGIVVQVFESGALVYDPGHLLDSPPGAGEVYPLKTYDPAMPTVDPLIAQLEAKVADLQKQLSAEPSQAIVKDMQQIKAIAGKY